jgi:hypothetical protein
MDFHTVSLSQIVERLRRFKKLKERKNPRRQKSKADQGSIEKRMYFIESFISEIAKMRSAIQPIRKWLAKLKIKSIATISWISRMQKGIKARPVFAIEKRPSPINQSVFIQ